MPGKCKFQDVWLRHSVYSSWIQPIPNDLHAVRCKLCFKTFNIANMGESALRSHSLSTKHIQNTSEKSKNLTLSTFVTKREHQSVDTCTLKDSKNNVVQSPSLGHDTSDVLSAEIIWAVKCVSAHYSYKSCTDIGETFKKMFPDSNIASQFSCGENKCAYLVTFGLGPYLANYTRDKLKEADNIVLMFDESHNDSLNKKQVDIHVRYWNNVTNRVISQYITSDFIGHGRAEDLLPVLLKSVSQVLGLTKIIQISMDGPTVNWKLWRLFAYELKKEGAKDLLNIGSCGLHTVHNAIKNGAEKSNFAATKVIKGLHWVFKDSPARREDFTNITGSEIFPLQFCGHRWIENKPVAKRAFEIWPNVVKYVETIQKKKDYKEPNSQSYITVREAVFDKVTPARLAFFQYVSGLLTPFLEISQSDRPLVPFLCAHIELMIRRIMRNVVKESVIQSASTVMKLLKIDIENSDNLRSYKKIDLGFKSEGVVRDLLEKKLISDRDNMELRICCRDFMCKIIKHLMEKTPVKFSLARHLDCLDPKVIIRKPDVSKSHFKTVLEHLIEAKQIDEGTCDLVRDEFEEFVSCVDQMTGKNRADFMNYDPLKSEPLDTLYYEHLHNQHKSFNSLWYVIRMLLTLSHGQAAVERGFSLNKEILVENMKAESLISQRQIIHHLNDIGGLSNFKVNSAILQYASSARRQYRIYLEDNKKALNEKSTSVAQKRKAIQEEISKCKVAKRQLEEDASSVIHAADQKAEMSVTVRGNKMKELILQSNSLRKSGREKEALCVDMAEKIKKMEEELKVIQ